MTPLATKDGHIFEHENGFDDDASPLTAFIESADLEIGAGDDVSFISRVVPDISFRDSTNDSATATFTLKAKDYPGITKIIKKNKLKIIPINIGLKKNK